MKWLWLAFALVVASPAAADPEPRIAKTGFTFERPQPEPARGGAYDRPGFTIYSPSLAFWVDAATLQLGDRLVLVLKGPDGGIMAAQDIRMDRAPDRYFAFAGAQRPPHGWKLGTYTGTVEILRGDRMLAERTDQIVLP